jgi:hypothetical protein
LVSGPLRSSGQPISYRSGSKGQARLRGSHSCWTLAKTCGFRCCGNSGYGWPVCITSRREKGQHKARGGYPYISAHDLSGKGGVGCAGVADFLEGEAPSRYGILSGYWSGRAKIWSGWSQNPGVLSWACMPAEMQQFPRLEVIVPRSEATVTGWGLSGLSSPLIPYGQGSLSQLLAMACPPQ